MGVVYAAFDERLRRPVALKFLVESGDVDDDSRERFVREARAASQLNHPGIVTIYEVGEHLGQPFIAMELVEGQSLKSRILSGPLGCEDALRIFSEVAEALEAAHSRGVTHRDLKPENIMLTPTGRAKIMDFGLARVAGESGITHSGQLVGTPAYMSPEQIEGRPATAASDLWSLGAVMYEALTGRQPFVGDNLLATVFAVIHEDPAPMTSLRSDLPDPLAAVVSHCQKKDPNLRPASAAEVLEKLRACAPSPAGPVRRAGAPNNLPVELSRFIGRVAELARVADLVRTCRLTCLVGAGGAGKTRLALRAGQELLAEFDHGVWFVDLAPLTDPDRIAPAMAAALVIREEPGRDMEKTLMDHLKARRLLLILDNCEHLIGACARLCEALLRGCPDLRIVATSREALGIPGEVAWPVPSMSMPRGSASVPEVRSTDAVRLFVDRACAARPGFEPSDAELGVIASIVWRLDGIPLAIELAAARVRALDLPTIATRLDDCFRLLTGGSRTALPRQQTLRAAIEWSHDLLSDEEKQLLRRLSVFAGGWTLEAAEEVCSDPGSGEDVMDLLTRLAEKSLVNLDGGTGGRQGALRYRFLETIRQFARERLRQFEEGGRFRARHFEWFLVLAESGNQSMGGERQGEWLGRLESEHANFRAALDWCLVDGEPTHGLRMASALVSFWNVRGHVEEGSRSLRDFLARVNEEDGDPGVRARARIGAGNLARLRGDFQEARVHLEDGYEAALRCGDRAAAAQALSGKAALEAVISNFRGAAELYEEALRLQRAGGDPRAIAQMANNLANVVLELGDYNRTAELYEEALDLARKAGDVRQTGIALYNLGYVDSALGEWARAEARLSEGLQLFREIGYRQGLAACGMVLGRVALQQGDPRRASELLDESLAEARRMSNRQLIANVLMYRGELALAGADLPGAARELRESLEASMQIGIRNDVVDCLQRILELLLELGSRKEAATLHGAVENLRAHLGHPLLPADEPRQAGALERLRAELGAKAFRTASAEGRLLDLAGAARLAMDSLPGSVL